MIERIRLFVISAAGIALSLFTVYDVNYATLPPLSQLAIFAMLGMVLCLLIYPIAPRLKDNQTLRAVDLLLAVAVVVCCTYLIWQGKALGDRAGAFTTVDLVVAVLGTMLVLEATRRSIGMALPILAGIFLLYAMFGPSMPDWLFPHRGYGVARIGAQCFLRTEGVFGIAMRIMFTYVFLFVVFGAFLEMSGATQFIVDFARRVFGRGPGGPAKVSVLASGLMGSLSGSAVANAVTTGTFTIPMMRSAGFKPAIAGGITAAAASGGALVPPVMGAGAYMMLEIVDPSVTFLQIAQAAIIPAILYYLSILMIVHFYSRRVGSGTTENAAEKSRSLWQFEGIVFFGALIALVGFLLIGYTPFRAVTYSLEVILLLSIISPRIKLSPRGRLATFGAFAFVTCGMAVYTTRQAGASLTDWTTWANAAIPAMLLLLLLGLFHPVWRPLILEAFSKAARSGIALVAASGCVGIIIGVVNLTGVGTAFPNAIVPLAEQSLLLALIAIMLCSIVLGMGLPSAVCYLLMATLIGPVLNRLGVIPLAAHLFIFYFGMMSMVTPPVALAAYASASIAKAKIMPTAIAAFRFSLVGFTLPFMFVYRPALLLMDQAKWQAWMQAPEGTPQAKAALKAANGAMPPVGELLLAVGAAVIGITALAAGIAGFFKSPLSRVSRVLFILAAAMLLVPSVGGLDVLEIDLGVIVNLAGAILFAVVGTINWRTAASERTVGGD